MTPARRRQLLQRLASQQTASGVALIRRQAEAEEARESFKGYKPLLQTARENPNPRPLVEAAAQDSEGNLTQQAAAQLEELAAQPIDGTTAEKLAEVLRPLPDPPAHQDAPGRPRKRKKPKTARRGRPPLAEAGGAAERLSVSLAPETLAAIARAAKRRRVRPGTVLRELAEAWASTRD